ncbi:hypothetical protein CKO45_23595 [Paracraurococcus ruber]|uniref:Uncharacterized protein n=1 Tax=Paracraurococcus ruber TaxID=77675 RepID=A0ABS1D327_9PROT|nr:hypothetical protein [Paracraurococcus ruber]
MIRRMLRAGGAASPSLSRELATLETDAEGTSLPPGLVEGVTRNAVMVQALLDDLVGGGSIRRPVCWSSGTAKALSKATQITEQSRAA